MTIKITKNLIKVLDDALKCTLVEVLLHKTV